MKHLKVLAIWLLFMLFLTLLSACTTTRYVEVPQVREVATLQRDTTATRDSIFIHDSVAVTMKGDTVMKEKYRIAYRDRWQYVVRTDSFVQRDTVTIVKEVARQSSLRQRLGQDTGLLLMGAGLAGLLLSLARILYNRYVKGGK